MTECGEFGSWYLQILVPSYSVLYLIALDMFSLFLTAATPMTGDEEI